MSDKPFMHDSGESYSGVVPVKQPNKSEPSPAEAVEGRPLTKENTQQPNPHRTPSRENGPSGLERVREAAKQDGRLKFTALLHHVSIDLLRVSYNSLKKRAAPGVDGMTWEEYGGGDLEARLSDLHGRIHRGAYRAQPSRRVGIPKADGRQRPLGIAALEDKIVQYAVGTVLNQVWEEDFLGFSYGFRPGRGPQDALDALWVGIVRKKVNWILDLDIRSFFDQVNHDILMGRIAQVVRDKRVLHLIGKFLRRGAMVDGLVEASVEATPQGGPLSPMLANIYLDALDKELERRGHPFCRYADDGNIYVGSQAAAERTLTSIEGWIEKHLRLKMNAAKSGTGRVWERRFLGFRLDREKRIGVAPESVERFKAKVRELWQSCQSRTSNQLRDAWQRYVRGWWGYYRLAEDRRPIFRLVGWIRRHIRKCFWLRWHSAVGRERALRRLGLRGRMLKVAFSSRGAWHLAGTGSLHKALANAVLRRYGFLMLSDLAVL